MKITYNNCIINFLVLSISCCIGCSALDPQKLGEYITRIEQDAFTITTKDTTVTELSKNAPGQRSNGIIYPSSKTLDTREFTTQYDSIVERSYPKFIRIGLFESVGLVGTSKPDVGIGSGMFGIMGYFDPDFGVITKGDTTRNVFFTGGIYRFGIVESRLRWFNDAKDWTIGTSIIEVITPEVSNDKSLFSLFPLYIRKRYFLREEIPYIAITPSFGFGYLGSLYGNIGASLDVGSLGGLNFRGYIGFAAGMNYLGLFVKDGVAVTSSIPYAGIGVSVLDFLNRVPELYKEWKDHEHSSWDVGLVQLTLLTSGADSSFIKSNSVSTPILKGLMLRLAPVSLALPIFNNNLYAGTSLFNIIVLGQNQFGAGILPVRLGFWQPLNENELSVEPFIEYNYFPSNFVHIGGKFNLKFGTTSNFFAQIGWVNGNTSNSIGEILTKHFGVAQSFTGLYFGIGVGILDRIFPAKDLRYNK